MKKTNIASALILGVFLLNFLILNTVSANTYDGKDYTLKSKDVKIIITDVDTSVISGLRPNEGILDIKIERQNPGYKTDAFSVECLKNNTRDDTILDICNTNYLFDTPNQRIHYIANKSKPNIKIHFTIYDGTNLTSYSLDKKIKLEPKNKKSEIKITSPKQNKKVYFGSDLLLKWKNKSKVDVNILNCELDKNNCSQITQMSGENKVSILVDTIMSGNSLIKVENSINPNYFDYVEVVALPR